MDSARGAREASRRAAARGWIVSVALLLLFLAWTWTVQPGQDLPPPPEVDWRLAETMKEVDQQHPFLDGAFIFFTELGGVWGLLALAVVGTVASLALRQWRLALVWAVAASGGAVLNLALKTAIDRPRPPAEMRNPYVSEHSESYPSGHAMGSIIGFGMLGYAGLLGLRRRGWQAALVVGSAVIILLVGASRIFLRAHWFSDVIAGFLMGGAWLALCLAALQWWQACQGQNKKKVSYGAER